MGKLTQRGQAFAEAGARLPAAIGPLGVITLVAATTTGSFAVAGAVAAAYGIGAATGGPVVGALADRLGQRVGLTAAILDAAAFAGIVLAVSHDAAPVVVGLLAALAGFATPQIGPL